jgi:uncharacterized protein (TIGR02996 family)
VDRETELLTQLAKRPFDRTVRMVFADWLSERDDPRGEVITLGDRGDLSLSERRRVARVTREHGRVWLGPLQAVADETRCRFDGGFVSHLSCRPPANPEIWLGLVSEPRLATVTSLEVPSGTPNGETGAFLRSSLLRGLKRLQAPASTWAQLSASPPPSFSLDVAAVSSWGVFQRELEALGSSEAAKIADRLELTTSEFVNPPVVRAVLESLAAQKDAWKRFRELRLAPRFGVVEGVASWLVSGATQGWQRWWKAGNRWSVEYGEGVFCLEIQGGRFSRLHIELGQRDEIVGLGQRIGLAASVLVQLGAAGIEWIEITIPSGARMRSSERDALRTAARRLGSVKSLVIGGAPLSP